jgi:hypothetical protein
MSDALHAYFRALSWIAWACAGIELALMVSLGATVGLDDVWQKSIFIIMGLAGILFLFAAIGLRRRAKYVYGLMIVSCSAGTLILLSLFIIGIWAGGIIAAGERILSEFITAVGATAASKQILFMILPVVLFFNPYNLWLFARSPRVRAIFVPPVPDGHAPALRRKEL